MTASDAPVVISYDIVLRSNKITEDGASEVEYVLGSQTLPDGIEFDQVMHSVAAAFRMVAEIIDNKLEES